MLHSLIGYKITLAEMLLMHFNSNAILSTIKTVYSEKTAYSIGSKNLKKPEIQSKIKANMCNIC
ncbi:terminase small subunit [uncultured Bacteroides sp.]|uniref:terminase small subunit n=1 Tax=uncultured Bacteroides sp. TaxID=162156 RepID=UPI003747E243